MTTNNKFVPPHKEKRPPRTYIGCMLPPELVVKLKSHARRLRITKQDLLQSMIEHCIHDLEEPDV